MSVVFILVFVAIIMASAFLIAFIWAVRNGQFEDTYTPSVRILFDDPEIKQEEKEGKSPNPCLDGRRTSPKGKGVSALEDLKI